MRKIITLLFFLSIGAISAQVGVGTPLPDASTQLDIVSNNKGVLIPRIPLTSSTDIVTIPNPANSLLVFNTNTVANDITPGYHYWDGAKWQRMTSMDEVVTLIQSNETITNLVDNGDGTITYTNEEGIAQTVNIADIITQEILNQGDIFNEIINLIEANTDVFQDNGDGTFTHTSADGTVVNFNANTTTMINNGDGTYVLTNANGDSITIDVIADIVNNITNQGDIFNELITVIDANSDVFQDNGDGTFTHTSADGTVVNFDANTTTMVNNGDGTYVFTNANGDSITIDVIADIVNNITNQGDIFNELITVIDANSDVFQDNGDGTFTHTSADGTVVNFDANTTTMVNNGDGTYVFTNANGDSITIDVIADVVNNIQNQGDIFNEITQVIDADADTTDDAWANDSANNRIELGTQSDGTTARPTGTEFVALDNGNVGIGTPSPTETLELAGSLKTKNQIAADNYSGFYSGTTPFDGFPFPPTANMLYSQDKETFDGQGPIGFLTTSPGRLTATANSNGPILSMPGPDSGTSIDLDGIAGSLSLRSYSGTTQIQSSFQTFGSGLSFRSEDFGNNNFSIATVNANSPLSFSFRRAGVTESYAFPEDNGDADQVLTTDGAGQLTWRDPSLSAINVEPWFGTDDNMGATDNTEDIYSLGRVGIGTTLPLGALHVVSENSDDALFVRSLGGDPTNDMDIDLIRTYGTAASPQIINQDGTRLGGLRYRGFVGLNIDPLISIPIFAEVSAETDGVPTATSAPGKLIFETTPTGSTIAQARMTIKNDGNVGIGTTAPSERLEVAGNVYASSGGMLLTDTSTYADYVFEDYVDGISKLNKNYTFKSLDEVEAFVKEFKHLPGVTGIKELKKTNNGYVVNITKLSGELLEKVEELFLHTIAQQKELDARDAKIQALEARLAKIEAILNLNNQ